MTDPTLATQIIDGIKPAAYSLVIIVVVLWFMYKVTTYILQSKRDQEVEAQKEARADKYTEAQTRQADALNSLARATDQLITLNESHSRQIQKTFDSLHTSMDKVNVSLRELTEFHTRIMTLDDSLRLIDHYSRELIRETHHVFCRAIRDGNYLARREFVARKIRTELADIYDGILACLQDYNLSVDPVTFFKKYEDWSDVPEHSYERFVLIDSLWSSVEPILANESVGAEDRCEEVTLLTINTVNDHFGSLSRKIREVRKTQTDRLLRQQEAS